MKKILVITILLIGLKSWGQDSIKYKNNNLKLIQMDLMLGDGIPIFFEVYEIATKIIQPNCGIASEGNNVEDQTSYPKNPDGSFKYKKVIASTKQQLLDYNAANQITDPEGWLNQF